MYNHSKTNHLQGIMPLKYLFLPDTIDDGVSATKTDGQLCTMCAINATDDAECNVTGIVPTTTTTTAIIKRSAHHPAIERLTLVKSIKAFAIFILVYLTTFPAVTHAFREYTNDVVLFVGH
jgi:hypothetical protein